MKTSKDLTLEEFNEKVCYCKSCHSLHILKEPSLAEGDWDGTFCASCGSSNIGICEFGIWLERQELIEQKKREEEWKK